MGITKVKQTIHQSCSITLKILLSAGPKISQANGAFRPMPTLEMLP